MQPNTITTNYSVAGQIQPADVDAVRELGFGTIICNRPDGEAPGQPAAAEIEAAAGAAGLAFHYNPLVPDRMTQDNVSTQGELASSAEKPVFAYCASGRRSTMLWMLANPEGLSADERIDCANAAGYDLAGLRPNL